MEQKQAERVGTNLWIGIEAKEKVALRPKDIHQVRLYKDSKRAAETALYITYGTSVSKYVEKLALRDQTLELAGAVAHLGANSRPANRSEVSTGA